MPPAKWAIGTPEIPAPGFEDDTTVNSLAKLSDEALVRRCRETLPQDTRAFEALVLRHQQQVYAVAYRMMGTAQAAEDLTQDVFVKVYRSLKRFRGDAAFSTWLYRVAVNACLDALNKRQRRALPLDIDLADVEDTQLLPRDQQSRISPEQAALRSELIECIRDTMMALREKERLMLTLRDVEGMEYQRIAEILNIGMSAVKMRIHRARLAFRRVFATICREFMPATQQDNAR